ncbi:hypothetical protein A7X84_02470 [Stenotrophomonas maltophilia]|uniref:hypothetical protein n=1 Tax=Stenotrophomonas maltophilia TaxID=40324 RepID=UPI000DA7AF8D|nr:hypothetical protein [Stenotrophomonas maltophilia]PZS77531.1 hypothetical protein A7X84_02470 [Stenotrophomonas maltophilia]
MTVVTAGGGAGIVVYASLKHFASSWLEDKFKSRLQEMVHDQNKEIERLKSELTRTFDRVTRLHQQEFEILPLVWDEVHEAFWQAAALVSSFQSYPDLNSMTPAHLEEFIAQCELDAWQKAELLEANDKSAKFRFFDYWRKASAARRAHLSALNKTSRHAIFLPESLKNEFLRILSNISTALVQHEVYFKHPLRPGSQDSNDQIEWMQGAGKNEMDELEEVIRSKLWSTRLT